LTGAGEGSFLCPDLVQSGIGQLFFVNDFKVIGQNLLLDDNLRVVEGQVFINDFQVLVEGQCLIDVLRFSRRPPVVNERLIASCVALSGNPSVPAGAGGGRLLCPDLVQSGIGQLFFVNDFKVIGQNLLLDDDLSVVEGQVLINDFQVLVEGQCLLDFPSLCRDGNFVYEIRFLFKDLLLVNDLHFHRVNVFVVLRAELLLINTLSRRFSGKLAVRAIARWSCAAISRFKVGRRRCDGLVPFTAFYGRRALIPAKIGGFARCGCSGGQKGPRPCAGNLGEFLPGSVKFLEQRRGVFLAAAALLHDAVKQGADHGDQVLGIETRANPQFLQNVILLFVGNGENIIPADDQPFRIFPLSRQFF